MVDFSAVYKNQSGHVTQDNAPQAHDAAVLLFPFAPSNTAKTPEAKADIIDRRMMFPLHENEMKVVLHMLQQRAKFMGEALWIATETFLFDMGVEELDDLRRCDFVRAIEHLVAFTDSAQAKKAMQ
jgi:hypothetical protein